MSLEGVQQVGMISVCHFTGILFPVPGTEKIRRICVDQHIRIVESGDYLKRRAILDLDPAQALSSFFYPCRSLTPAFRSVSGPRPCTSFFQPTLISFVLKPCPIISFVQKHTARWKLSVSVRQASVALS